MKIYTILLLSSIPFFLTAQTTMEEYDYLTSDYPNQIRKSEIAEKSGYYFQDLMNMVDNSGKIRLFYKENQMSVVPTATLIHVNGDAKVYYICVPHEDSDRMVFDKYADDLQALFEDNELARVNYSKIMLRYPKQLQKYYDEISVLENGREVTSTADMTPVKVENEPQKPTVTTNPERNIKEEKEEATSTKVKPEPEKIIIKPTTSEEVKPRKKGKSSAQVYSVLTRRDIIENPTIVNETEKFGVIRMDICVDQKGEIISVKYNKDDSDTKDEELLQIAENLTKQYLFEKSHLSRQCGYIIFKFQ
ncbi:MAG: hypothetical protein HC803_08535 [Saprospiraceae bacterium]|nr:hypothetical protein [Saprospiraceae bacterium]